MASGPGAAAGAPRGDPEGVRRVADEGASLDARAHGRTLLHHAAWIGDVELVAVLLELGADPQVLDDDHAATPLGWAEWAYEGAGRLAVGRADHEEVDGLGPLGLLHEAQRAPATKRTEDTSGAKTTGRRVDASRAQPDVLVSVRPWRSRTPRAPGRPAPRARARRGPGGRG